MPISYQKNNDIDNINTIIDYDSGNSCRSGSNDDRINDNNDDNDDTTLHEAYDVTANHYHSFISALNVNRYLNFCQIILKYAFFKTYSLNLFCIIVYAFSYLFFIIRNTCYIQKLRLHCHLPANLTVKLLQYPLLVSEVKFVYSFTCASDFLPNMKTIF